MASQFNVLDYARQLEAAGIELTSKIDDLKFAVNARIDKLEAELRTEIRSINHELMLHRWLLGLVLAVSTTSLALLFKMLAP